MTRPNARSARRVRSRSARRVRSCSAGVPLVFRWCSAGVPELTRRSQRPRRPQKRDQFRGVRARANPAVEILSPCLSTACVARTKCACGNVATPELSRRGATRSPPWVGCVAGACRKRSLLCGLCGLSDLCVNSGTPAEHEQNTSGTRAEHVHATRYGARANRSARQSARTLVHGLEHVVEGAHEADEVRVQGGLVDVDVRVV